MPSGGRSRTFDLLIRTTPKETDDQHARPHHPRPRRRQRAPAGRPGRAATSPSSRPWIVLVAEHLCDTADLQAGWRVLDVATGSGNAAIAAARHGCIAVGVDYVPALLERGRRRADAEGLAIELLEGDAAVAAVRGRVLRRGHVGLRLHVRSRPRQGRGGAAPRLPARRNHRAASWTPDSFIGELFRMVSAHVPAARRRAVADALGHRGAPARAPRRRNRVARARGADVHVQVPVGAGARSTSSAPGTARR